MGGQADNRRFNIIKIGRWSTNRTRTQSGDKGQSKRKKLDDQAELAGGKVSRNDTKGLKASQAEAEEGDKLEKN